MKSVDLNDSMDKTTSTREQLLRGGGRNINARSYYNRTLPF